MTHEHDWEPDGDSYNAIQFIDMPENDWHGCTKKFCPERGEPHSQTAVKRNESWLHTRCVKDHVNEIKRTVLMGGDDVLRLTRDDYDL